MVVKQCGLLAYDSACNLSTFNSLSGCSFILADSPFGVPGSWFIKTFKNTMHLISSSSLDICFERICYEKDAPSSLRGRTTGLGESVGCVDQASPENGCAANGWSITSGN